MGETHHPTQLAAQRMGYTHPTLAAASDMDFAKAKNLVPGIASQLAKSEGESGRSLRCEPNAKAGIHALCYQRKSG